MSDRIKVQDIRWRMKNGRLIRIGDMSHRHLHNTIRMLKRQRDTWQDKADAAASYPGNPDGEGAREADLAMDRAFDKVHEKTAWLERLYAEVHRRQNLSTGDEAIEIMQEAC